MSQPIQVDAKTARELRQRGRLLPRESAPASDKKKRAERTVAGLGEATYTTRYQLYPTDGSPPFVFVGGWEAAERELLRRGGGRAVLVLR